jgi:predicted ATPase
MRQTRLFNPKLLAMLDAPSWSRCEGLIKAFEEAWQRGAAPAIADYLGVDGPERRALLAELIHVELEFRLKAGEPARVETYLQSYPELANDRPAALDLLAAEYALRGRHPGAVRLEEYRGRFPDLWEDLCERVTTLPDDSPAPAKADAASDPVGWPAVPGYEIVAELGRGGMGIVYKALEPSLGRHVALKFLPTEYAHDPNRMGRFLSEARTASALNHPHICTVHALGEHQGRPFLVLEFIEGATLREVAEGRPSAAEAARLVGQAARALAAAHAASVVHRDVKPENVMVRADGYVKVLDFGLARWLPAGGTQRSTSVGVGTDVGTRVGTLLYMSPEQARAEPVDAATDIFSLGIVLYELTTGQHPFRADSEVGVLHAIIAQAPVPPARLNPEIPAALDALILHMLAKDSRLRPTAVEVEATLARLTVHIGEGAASPLAGPGRRPTVGREQEGADLRTGFEEAAAGRGLVLCVTGEPGLGKTTLVERFLDEMTAGGRSWGLARGRCSERLAGAEAYLPFLDALDGLLQGEGGAAAAQAMKLLAPSWYVQLAPLAVNDPSLARVLAQAKEASQEQRKRELGAFLHEVSRQRPLVVFLDDVHWADPSSVDLLAYLGSRCEAWRLLLVLTYRPSDLLRSGHPFGPVKLDLQGRGVCREIALPFLSRDDFDRYLALAFAGHQFPDDFAAVLHARTEGNPLFMVDLLCDLRDRGVIVQDHGSWALVRAVPDLQRELPESVRAMIRRKVDQLSSADRHLLMAASVQGPEFDSAVVARLLGRGAADVEERLEVLERVHVMVRLVREHTFPDRTLTLRYGFVHVLYQNALYAALRPTRKAAWSAAAARAILGHYGEKSAAVAAELALLFEAARDPERAADYYQVAAGNAARLFAHHEAVALARRGLESLQALPDTPERVRREIPMLVTLGVQLQVTHGYAAPEAERAYDRARALCEQVQEAPSLFLVLWGLWMYFEVGSHLGKSRELAGRLFTLAQHSQDPAQLLQAHMAQAVTSFSIGELAATRDHTEQGVRLYDPSRHGGHKHLYGQDPRVTCLAFGAVALWLLGYPKQAVERSREAVALGGHLGHPTTHALALYFAAMLRQYCREAPSVQDCAEATTAIANEHALSLWRANGLIMRGWAVAVQGAWAGGIAQIRQGLTAWVATGAETHRTYFLGLLAEALGRGGLIEEGLGVLTESLTFVHGTGTVFYAAELHRLRGEFLLRQETAEVAGPEAEACFRRALDVARSQQAKSLELRAAMSLARLFRRQGRQAEARPVLAACYGWFTEGFDTADLHEAKTLLEELAVNPH